MKLRDVYVRCKRCYENLEWESIEDADREDIYRNIEIIEGIECLQDSLYEIRKLLFKINVDPGDDLDDDPDKFLNIKCKIDFRAINNEHECKEKFHDLLIDLRSKLLTIINLCEMLGLKNEKTIGIDIKLPPNCNLTDLKQYISDLEFIFTKCPFFQNDKEELKFQNMDIGSIWLNFFIAGVALETSSIILNNIAAFIDKCFVIRSHRLSVLQQKKDIEKMEAEMEIKKDLIESANKLYKFEVYKAINELEEKSGRKLKDGEERGIVEQSIEKTENLIDKGLQIYSTIDSPKETKALFEPLEMKYLDIANELKRLEKKDKDE